MPSVLRTVPYYGLAAPHVDSKNNTELCLTDQPGSETCRPPHVFVVDDDAAQRGGLAGYLEEQGMRVISLADGPEVMHRIVGDDPSLIIVDMPLPWKNGFDLLRRIRSRSNVPVIITSDARCTEIDRAVGLELGADDHVVKPYSQRELLARIRAILRRRDAAPVTEAPRSGTRYRFGGWQLDRHIRRLTAPDGTPVGLTKGEYTLLNIFLGAPGRPLSREYLLQSTRLHEDVFDRSIDVQILRLRRKLQTEPGAPSVIQTERGIGYVLAVPVEAL